MLKKVIRSIVYKWQSQEKHAARLLSPVFYRVHPCSRDGHTVVIITEMISANGVIVQGEKIL